MKDEERRTSGAKRIHLSAAMDLKTRTRNFALRVIRLCSALPKTPAAQVIGKQLLRSGTSVGAHYREGCRSRSDAEFVSKLEGGLQELSGIGVLDGAAGRSGDRSRQANA